MMGTGNDGDLEATHVSNASTLMNVSLGDNLN